MIRHLRLCPVSGNREKGKHLVSFPSAILAMTSLLSAGYASAKLGRWCLFPTELKIYRIRIGKDMLILRAKRGRRHTDQWPMKNEIPLR
jgi:hypothetical protein